MIHIQEKSINICLGAVIWLLPCPLLGLTLNSASNSALYTARPVPAGPGLTWGARARALSLCRWLKSRCSAAWPCRCRHRGYSAACRQGKPMECVGVGMQQWGGNRDDPPDIGEVLQKSPLVWKRGEAARRGVHRRQLGVSQFILSVGFGADKFLYVHSY